jgi:hypothetical protein
MLPVLLRPKSRGPEDVDHGLEVKVVQVFQVGPETDPGWATMGSFSGIWDGNQNARVLCQEPSGVLKKA